MLKLGDPGAGCLFLLLTVNLGKRLRNGPITSRIAEAREGELDCNPMQAGRELDAFIHHRILKRALSYAYPCYSTDPKVAETLRKGLEKECGVKMVIGTNSLVGTRWFARYEIEPGKPVEVLAETCPLAICRLALLRALNV